MLVLLAFLVYAIVMEYIAHRWLMHRKQSLTPKWIWHDHIVGHHIKERKDINIDMPPTIVWVGSAPFIAVILLLGYYWQAAVIFAGGWLYSYLWTHIHRTIHGVENHWLLKYKFAQVIKKHHLKHHQQPTVNFGTIFPFSDYFFGTKKR